MRFVKLMLERYGRFEGCELDFRERQPDLHVIYGPNEAGKSTSLSAVSDLLFGFPTRLIAPHQGRSTRVLFPATRFGTSAPVSCTGDS